MLDNGGGVEWQKSLNGEFRNLKVPRSPEMADSSVLLLLDLYYL